jgi:hypothetical protein
MAPEVIMATAPTSASPPPEVPELHTGDRMTREEFHRVYEQMPPGFKAELIGGIVYVGSPLRLGHGKGHVLWSTLYGFYVSRTPGVEAADNTTLLLGDDAEPQPDLFLRILPEFGGQSRTTEDDYVLGAPEQASEVALSSRSIDLHAKREDYARHGVLEYLVLCLKDRQLRWFDLRADQELQPDADGIFRIRTFPGLWFHGEALAGNDYQRSIATLDQGLATPEHAEFVQRLATNRSK